MKIDPRIGEIWRHHRGTLYLVYDITNLKSGKDNFPKRVSYMDGQGNQYSRDLVEWHLKFKKDDVLSAYDALDISNMAMDVQGLIDNLRMRFLRIRLGALEFASEAERKNKNYEDERKEYRRLHPHRTREQNDVERND